MTTSQLPVELQAPQAQLHSLRKPHEPYLNDRVAQSESALEGESVIGLLIYALLPWWAEGFAEGGSGEGNEIKDYLIGSPLAFAVTATCLAINTDLEWWNILAPAMIAATGAFLALIVFHLVFHKVISMVIYNHIFRRGWMKKTRQADKQNYEEELASYPQRLKEYEASYAEALNGANVALKSYNSGNPSRQYTLEAGRFKPVSGFDNALNLATRKAIFLAGKFINRR